MLLLFCRNPLLKPTYETVLAPLDGRLVADEATFWALLPEAKLVIVDDDEALCRTAHAKGWAQTFLFLGTREPPEDADVHFLKKPVSVLQLAHQIELLSAFVRRGLVLSFETTDFRFDGAARTLTSRSTGAEVRLTVKEAELIQYLFDNRHRIVSKDELLEQIFGYREGVETHTLETHIYKLRQKMGPAGDALLLTIDGGYQLQGVLT